MAVLVAVVLAGYLHTLPYPFHFDDYQSIRDNPTLTHPTDLAAIWSFHPPRVALYTSLAWNAALTGRSPAGFRAVNLLVHLLNALLVGWIAAELTRRLVPAARAAGPRASRLSPEAIGLMSAALFAAHPLATQAVTYLVQRTASLAALFELASVAAYLRARRGGPAGLWVAAWGCAWLAALTKEMAIALPLVIALLEVALRRAGAPRRPSLSALLPFLLVEPIVAYTAQLPSGLVGQTEPGFRSPEGIPRLAYLFTQMLVIPAYLRLLIWPAGQALEHEVVLRTSPDASVLAGAALLAAACVAALRVWNRHPVVTIGWAWFMVTILPESSIFPISDFMAEHRAYLPLAGVSWIGATLLLGLFHHRRARLLAPALLVVALTAVTHARNRVWRSEERLWSDVVRKSPGKASGHNNLGIEFRRTGRYAEAESCFRRAIASEPRSPNAYLNLGSLYAAAGRPTAAVAVLESATVTLAGQWRVQMSLGSARWLAGDTAGAALAYRRAAELAPGERGPREALARLRTAAPTAP